MGLANSCMTHLTSARQRENNGAMHLAGTDDRREFKPGRRAVNPTPKVPRQLPKYKAKVRYTLAHVGALPSNYSSSIESSVLILPPPVESSNGPETMRVGSVSRRQAILNLWPVKLDNRDSIDRLGNAKWKMSQLLG